MFKKFKPIIIITVIYLALAGLFLPHSTFADSSSVVETNYFGNIQDDSNGCGVYTILALAVDILSMGVILAAVIGATIVGIKYLTAKDNTDQTKKARNRMLEIVIGLVVYAVLYAGVQFILPGGHFNGSSSCTTISDEELAKIRAEEKAKKEEANKKPSQTSPTKTKKDNKTDLSKWYQAMSYQARYMKNAKYGSNYKSNYRKSKYEGTCITYPSTALQKLGVIHKDTYIWYNCGISGTASSLIQKRTDVFQVTYPNETVTQLYRKGKIKKGDIVFYQYNSCGVGHTMIFTGFNSKGKPLFNTFGHSGMKTNNAHGDGSKKVKMLIHLKKTSL